MSSPRFRVLSAYRALFRARSKVFRGDHVALRESRAEIRKHFDHNAGAETAGPNFESLLEMARDAADMLRHGIVQGTLNERTGHYEVKFEPEHVVEDRSHVEPITQETVKKFQSPVVQKTTASRSDT